MRVLVVEDNTKLARFLVRMFTEEGWVADACTTGVEGVAQATSGRYDLVVLDWMLPELDGLSVCRTLRRRAIRTPVLMLTARGDLGEKVVGLEAGADDYLVKPFEIEELLARARALVRRAGGGLERLRVAALEIDPVGRVVSLEGKPLHLTAREYALLTHLVQSAGRPVTRTELLVRVWGLLRSRLEPGRRAGEPAAPEARRSRDADRDGPRRRIPDRSVRSGAVTFRARLVGAFSAVTAVTILLAFSAASVVVMRSEERQLDLALRSEAREEATEIANLGAGEALQITDRGGPIADDVGRLTKYAVLYAADGKVIDQTSTFGPAQVPRRAELPAQSGVPFDLHLGNEQLRAILVPVSLASDRVLLLAASRADMEKDFSILWQVMLTTALLSICCIVVVTWRVVRRLTRGHAAISAAAREIAAGNLQIRVGPIVGDREVAQLAQDIDEMVGRLGLLVQSQVRFVAYAAHELRSPLAVLYGGLQLALRRARSAEAYRAAIEDALETAKQLNLLAEDLLLLAGAPVRFGDVQHCRPVALDEIVQRSVRSVGAAARARGLTLDIDVEPVVIETAPLDVERLLRNLLDNAIRYSPQAGRITLRAEVSDGQLELSVLDEGPGVAPSERERIFQPFFRSASARGQDSESGSGLGLAIVRELAAAHDGEVSVEQGPEGRGALFRARLRIGGVFATA